MQSKKVLDSPRLRELRKQKKKNRRNKIILGCVFFIVFFVGLGFVARIPEINIKSVQISGNRLIETADLEKFIKDELSGYYFWLYPKSNVFIYPRHQLVKNLLTNFKRLEIVEQNLNSNTVLDVSVRERGPKYLWCNDKINCYFTDDSGYVFDSAPYFTGDVYIKFFGGMMHANTPIGERVADNDFPNLVNFAEAVKTIGPNVTEVHLLDEKNAEMYLAMFGNVTPPKILFSRSDDLVHLAENLKGAWESDPLKSEIKNKYAQLLYIDLRFGNKVYYKFTNPQETEPTINAEKTE